MKLLFHFKFRKLLLLFCFVMMTAQVARAQTSRLQLNTLDHLAAKASQTVDVNIDEPLIQSALKIFSDKDVDEREIKDLISSLKGIYVKSFEFENEGQYSQTDLQPIKTQLQD